MTGYHRLTSRALVTACGDPVPAAARHQLFADQSLIRLLCRPSPS